MTYLCEIQNYKINYNTNLKRPVRNFALDQLQKMKKYFSSGCAKGRNDY